MKIRNARQKRLQVLRQCKLGLEMNELSDVGWREGTVGNFTKYIVHGGHFFVHHRLTEVVKIVVDALLCHSDI